MGVLTKGKYTFGNKTKIEIIQLTNTSVALTGTVSISSGATALTGSGTLFLTELLPGDIIKTSSGVVLMVQSIASNTSLTTANTASNTVVSLAFDLINSRRVKAGDSVFNVTDRFPMFYSGNIFSSATGIPTTGRWIKGDFTNGQVVPGKNGQATSSILEGNVLRGDTANSVAVIPYTSVLDQAWAVSYQLVYGQCCIPNAVCGIHNTDCSGVVTKGNFTQPNSAGSNVVDDGATSTADNAGIACTASGTPVAGEIEMLVNFHERL